MSLTAAINTLTSHFNTEVTIAHSLPTRFPNMLTGPGGTQFTEPEEAAWCELFVSTGNADLMEIGYAKRTDTFAMMSVRLHTPLGKGIGALTAWYDIIAPLFRSRNLGSNVTTLSPRLEVVGDKGKWFIGNVYIPCRFQEVTIG